MFIKAGDSETKEGPQVEEATGERKTKKGSWTQVQGVSPEQAAAACCSPGCKSRGDP